MAFVPINPADVLTGEPVTTDLGQLIKENFDDHESRILALDTLNTVQLFDLTVIRPQNAALINRNIPVYRASFALRLTGFSLSFPGMFPGDTFNGTGTLNIQLEKSTDNGSNWSSILSAPITATTQQVGDVITTINYTLGQDELNAGDMLRFQYVVGSIRAVEPNHHLVILGEPT